MSADIWSSIGAITFLICVLVFVIGLIILLINPQQKMRSLAKRMLLFGLIGAVIGFGVCTANFELYLP